MVVQKLRGLLCIHAHFLYVSEFEKRCNFVQKMIFRFIAERESVFNKLCVALCSKSLAATVPKERVDEYRACEKQFPEINVQALTSG